MAEASAPLVGVIAFLLATLAVFTVRAVLVGRPHTPEIDRRERTILAKFFQEWWFWLYRPVESFCLRAGISPDAITIAGTKPIFTSG